MADDKDRLEIEVETQAEETVSAFGRLAEQVKKLKDVFSDAMGTTKRSTEDVSKAMRENEQIINANKEQIKNLERSIADTKEQLRFFADAFLDLHKPDSIETLATQLERFSKSNPEIEVLRSNLGEMEETVRRLRAETEELVLENEKLSQSAQVARETTDSVDRLSDSLEALRHHLKSAAEKSSIFVKGLSLVGRSVKTVGKTMGRTAGLLSRFANQFGRSQDRLSGFNHMVSRSLKTVFRRVFVYQVIMKLIRGFTNYLTSALKTNDEFVKSLNTINWNLKVAFQPIYEAVLPALLTLMRVVATVTQYIAAAVSMLFGKTYKQSQAGAKSLNKSMKDLNKGVGGVGKSAKKAKKEIEGMLAPFDELNIIQTDFSTPDGGAGGGGGGGGGFEVPPAYEIDSSGLDEFMEKLSKLFEPIKKAWDEYGKSVMDNLKYALDSIKTAMVEVGRTWVSIWLDGTGQRLVESILRVLREIFGAIGDIAVAFTNAWVDDSGERVVRTIYETLIDINSLIEVLLISWREMWNSGEGERFFTNILELIEGIVGTVGDMAKSIRDAWFEADLGVSIFTNISNIINNLIELFNRVIDSVREFLGEKGQNMASGFLSILDNITEIISNLTKGFKTLWDNGGERFFEGALSLGSELISLLSMISEEYITPLINKFIELASGALGVVLDKVANIFDVMSEFINWLQNDGKPVLDMIIGALEYLALAF